jgi:hypothetical protein
MTLAIAITSLHQPSAEKKTKRGRASVELAIDVRSRLTVVLEHLQSRASSRLLQGGESLLTLYQEKDAMYRTLPVSTMSARWFTMRIHSLIYSRAIAICDCG